MSNRHVRAARQQLKYGYRSGNRYGVPAEVAGSELARIESRDGVITPRAVIDEAAPVSSPLHPAFEWNDDAAADAYRLHQARQFIRSVTIIRPDGDEAPRIAYVHVPPSDRTKAGYYATEVVAQHPDMYTAALNSMAAYLQSLGDAVQELQEAAEQQGKDAETVEKIVAVKTAVGTAQQAAHALR